MEQLFKEALAEALYQNALNESSMSDDIGKWEALLFPLIKKIYPESLVEQIASIQPTKTPLAKISYLNAIYTGNKSNNENEIHWSNSRLLTLPVSAQNTILADGSTVYTIDSTPPVNVKCFYGEVTNEFVTTEVSSGITQTQSVSAVPTYWNVLIASVSGALDYTNGIHNVVAGNNIGSTPILYSTTNRNTIKKVFKSYSNVSELNTDLREVNFETATKIIETTSRKIRSKFTQEKLTDLKNLYNEKAYDLVAEAIANEIQQEIDREIIHYLKQIATPMLSDINFPISLGMQSGLDAITYDAVGSIFLAAEEIVKATKRNRTMFVLADSATCAFLLLNPFHTEVISDKSNPYRVGKIGAYDLFCDPYSTEHYVIVGYNFSSKDKHDAGLFFSPYSTTIHELTSGLNNFEQNFLTMNRYAFTRHPQDSGIADGDSDFFRIFSVNFQHNGLIVPNFPEQFRTNY